MRNLYLTLIVFVFSISLNAQALSLELFATGLSSPLEMSHAGDDRLFIVEQGGRIKILNPDGSVNPVPFLNISSLVSTGGERGLLGLAFAPDYATTGRFYVNYTNTSGNSVIARYTVSSDPDIANTQGTILLTFDQPFSNHNGGTLKFGPDGCLWISTGDGGSGGDPYNNGQNKNTFLGKILRIDVSGDTYTIPDDNPFSEGGGKGEIWHYGLRNPWKFSFDKETQDLWIADVGQNAIEEINMTPWDEGGLNFGWRCYEGNDPYNTQNCDSPDTMIFPVAVYNHSQGRCSITGGYVYRGMNYPNLMGKYIFGDYCSGEIGWVDGNNLEFLEHIPNLLITSFGEDKDGELYLIGSGKVYKIKGSSLGLNDMNKFKPEIYPNPFIDTIYIRSNKTVDKAVLYSAEGKLLLETDKVSDQISLKGIASGIYLLNLTSGNSISSFKILKK